MSKLNIKKAIALASAAAMMAGSTACGEKTTWGAEINGTQVPAGVFIYYLQNAYYDAQSKAETPETAEGEEAPDIFTLQIEGKSAKDWMLDEATKSMQEYCAIEEKFAERGLSLTAEEKEAAQLYSDQLWDYGGEYYMEMGISQKSYLSVYLNGIKREKLFGSYYFEGGENAVSDDEAKSYLDENYALINYIDIELKDGEGNLLKSDGIAERRAMAEDYIARYNNGEDFDLLRSEYDAYYQSLKDAAAASESENKIDTEGIVDVEPSDAQAPLDGEGDTLPEESEAPESDGGDVSETEPAETAATENTEASEIAQSEEASEGVPASEENAEVFNVESNKTVIEKDGNEPNADISKAVFEEMSKGEIKIVESADGEHLYLVVKLDVLETDEYYNTAKESLIYEMKSDDFDAMIEQWMQSQVVVKNEDSYKKYDPEKTMKS